VVRAQTLPGEPRPAWHRRPVKTRLRCMKYRTDGLLDGFIAETGLTLEPPQPDLCLFIFCTG
jgi:hypothetical protein